MSKKLLVKQLVEVIFRWLSYDFNEKEINKKSEDFGYKIKNNKDFNVFYFELLLLNVWMIEYMCEGLFTDTENKDDFLERFHQLVYNRYIDKDECSVKDWAIVTTSLFIEYDEAMRTDHPSSPLWIVTNVINKRLFGEIKKDLSFQLKMINYISLYMESLGEFLIKIKEKYDLGR
jgi:hypothetical protein